eukprot:2829_1
MAPAIGTTLDIYLNLYSVIIVFAVSILTYCYCFKDNKLSKTRSINTNNGGSVIKENTAKIITLQTTVPQGYANVTTVHHDRDISVMFSQNWIENNKINNDIDANKMKCMSINCDGNDIFNCLAVRR